MHQESLREDRAAQLTDLGVMVSWLGLQCCCRCRHCSLSSGGPISAVPFERAKALAIRFVHWREEEQAQDFTVDLLASHRVDSPLEKDCLRFAKAYGGFSPFLPLNGSQFRAQDEWRALLTDLREEGATHITTTFFGLPETHDRWAGRQGDFDHLLSLARASSQCGMPHSQLIFLSRDSIPELPSLLEALDALPNREERHIGLWDYRGRGKALESQRVTSADVQALPARVRDQVHLGSHGGLRPESEWLERIAAGDFKRRSRRYFVIAVWPETIDSMEATDCGAILQQMRQADDAFLGAIPSMRRLAHLYGRPEEQRLYTLRDMEWKWIDQFLADHPEIDAAPNFDDRKTTVMWS